MVKTFSGRRFDSYDEETKGELYLVFAHFLNNPDGFTFRDGFKNSYIKYLEKTKNKSINDQQYKGYLGLLSKINLFGHENRHGDFHPDNRIYLNGDGKEFYYYFINDILSYGKKKKLDLFLSPEIKKYIPNIYLNSLEN